MLTEDSKQTQTSTMAIDLTRLIPLMFKQTGEGIIPYTVVDGLTDTLPLGII